MIPAALDVRNYQADGFQQVCRVVNCSLSGGWNYADIDMTVMYSDHKSWVYFIVVGFYIVKVGETGNPLGIKSRSYLDHLGWQPITGTQSRLGRYRRGDGTDQYVRDSLRSRTRDQQVSIWARKCQTLELPITIQGQQRVVQVSMHKHLETDILKHMLAQGQWPELNKAMK